MAKLFGLNREDARTLRAIIEWFKGSRGSVTITGPAPMMPTCKLYLVKLDGTVSGRSGSTPGSQTASICRIGDDGDLEETTADSVTVYNAFESDSGAADTYIFVGKDVFGTFWVLSEDCP